MKVKLHLYIKHNLSMSYERRENHRMLLAFLIRAVRRQKWRSLTVFATAVTGLPKAEFRPLCALLYNNFISNIILELKSDIESVALQSRSANCNHSVSSILSSLNTNFVNLFRPVIALQCTITRCYVDFHIRCIRNCLHCGAEGATCVVHALFYWWHKKVSCHLSKCGGFEFSLYVSLKWNKYPITIDACKFGQSFPR